MLFSDQSGSNETRRSKNFFGRSSCLVMHCPKIFLTPTITNQCLARENSGHFPTGGFPMKWHLRNECRNSILMMYGYLDLGSASDWIKASKFLTNQKHYPDLGSEASSVWDFCACFSDIITQGNHQWCLEMSSIFLG